MWFLIFLIVMILITNRMVIAADKESFYSEKKSEVEDFVSLLSEGFSVEEVKDVVKKFNGLSEPCVKEIEGENSIYISDFDWVESSWMAKWQYKGEIKMYFKNGCLVNKEICLK